MLTKVEDILICPHCQGGNLEQDQEELDCPDCGDRYELIAGRPFLLEHKSPIRPGFKKLLSKKTRKNRIVFNRFFPSQRLWSLRSKRLIKKIIQENDPREGTKFLNMGSGSEKIFQKLYREIDEQIIRIGLPHIGKIDIYGDAMNLPVRSESIDLMVSSSVFEHIQDPERAAQEMGRVCKKEGKIYVEIPFIRGYHMAPIDYQRYTIQGIEELFKRHGFEMIEKGVCSGTFNALVLIWLDLLRSISPPGFKKILRFIFSWLLHPFKYLDYLFENSRANQNLACNFYYYGRKI